MSIQGLAHGRVNLIGEHTDYNDGFVLPAAIPHHAVVKLTLRSDSQVHILSRDIPAEKGRHEYHYILGEEKKTGDWPDYVQGITQLLVRAGHAITGFQAELHSTVPIGSGLSSSAAIEVAFLRALKEAFRLEISSIEIAKLAQRVENEFVGAHVGIMDQMSASLAELGSALFIDVQSLEYKKIALPTGYSLAIINSGISHSNAGGDYNTRRAECEEACRNLNIKTLRALELKDLPKLDALPDKIKRRARHVITENARVLKAVQAITANDLVQLGKLFVQSHESMRDDYQISIPEIDLLVTLALEQTGTYGARLTGGGFGGSMIVLAEKDKTVAIAKKIMAQYHERTGKNPTLLVPEGNA